MTRKAYELRKEILALAQEGDAENLRLLLTLGSPEMQEALASSTRELKPVLCQALTDGPPTPEIIQILVQVGATLTPQEKDDAPINHTTDPAIARFLLELGADPRQFQPDALHTLLGLNFNEDDQPFTISLETYRQQRSPQFGNSNPERMDKPFWEEMVRRGCSAYSARRFFKDDGYTCGPQDPVWCTDRFGQSVTFLPDGRIIQIAGEHEDSYDPDFCIYNDVFVHHPDASFQIYGYPKEAFPPTDFHSATLVGDFIYIIGNLGYSEDRKPTQTPVYRLHIHTYTIEPVPTTGENPGWIYSHQATLTSPNEITIKEGTLFKPTQKRRNTLKTVTQLTKALVTKDFSPLTELFQDPIQPHTYTLNLQTFTWTKQESHQ